MTEHTPGLDLHLGRMLSLAPCNTLARLAAGQARSSGAQGAWLVIVAASRRGERLTQNKLAPKNPVTIRNFAPKGPTNTAQSAAATTYQKQQLALGRGGSNGSHQAMSPPTSYVLFLRRTTESVSIAAFQSRTHALIH